MEKLNLQQTTAAAMQPEYENRSLDTMCVNDSVQKESWFANLKYGLVGLMFGVVFVKAEVISWFRIQEMFRFQSFHMYGIIGTAVTLGMILTAVIKKYKLRDFSGSKIVFQPKEKSVVRYIAGGTIFGLGWALTGACPGPMVVNLGAGYLPMLLVVVGATLGTFLYGALQKKLPH